ncbi:MAG TPA: GNAT family N-acetyltransferase [Acetobacteraceae bacterium]|nr:GNAT family N-acetyltransferase [Acetobacteraceae bacterium]
MPAARRAERSDLESLLALLRASEVSAVADSPEHRDRIWSETLARDGLVVFVANASARIVASCMLITAPNLLRGGRAHGFLENVVTHPEHRGQGYGRAVVQAALNEAWARDCHHVLLQSGRQDPRVHRFYQGCGFEPGVRTAYVARRPPEHALTASAAARGS